MEKLDLTTVPKLKPNPIFKGMPAKLKDPKNYKEIETKLQRCLISDHKHKTLKTYMKCERCQAKFQKRKVMMKEMGFKDGMQYAEWKKIMSIIINEKSFQLR